MGKKNFKGFKQKLLDDNRSQYGEEIKKYGDDVIDASNAKMTELTAGQYAEIQELTCRLNNSLKKAFVQGNPASVLAQKVCALHKEWLGYFWDIYSKEAHLGLVQTYLDDPRFRNYYDTIAKGCAKFLYDALKIYYK